MQRLASAVLILFLAGATASCGDVWILGWKPGEVKQEQKDEG